MECIQSSIMTLSCPIETLAVWRMSKTMRRLSLQQMTIYVFELVIFFFLHCGFPFRAFIVFWLLIVLRIGWNLDDRGKLFEPISKEMCRYSTVKRIVNILDVRLLVYFRFNKGSPSSDLRLFFGPLSSVFFFRYRWIRNLKARNEKIGSENNDRGVNE